MILTFILLAIYIAALIYIGFKDHKTEDANGFIIADRKVGIIGTFSSITASLRCGGVVMIWIGLGYALGYAPYMLVAGGIIAMFLFSLIAPRVRQLAEKKNYITISQMIKDTIGIKTEKLSSILIIMYGMALITAEFWLIGKLLEMLLGINPVYTILTSIIVVGFYVSAGGYKSIVRTDIFQFFIMLGLFVVALFMPIDKSHLLDFSSFYKSLPWSENISAMLWYGVILFSFADFWQRIFSAKDDKTAKRGLSLTGIAILSITIPLLLIGLSARSIVPADTDPNEVLFLILESTVYAPFIISFLTVSLFSMIMSTLDTNAYMISSTVLENILRVDIKSKKKKYIYLSKIVMISMLIFTAIASFFIEDIVYYLFGASSVMMILSPLFIATGTGWLKHKSNKLDLYITISMVLSFIISLYYFLSGQMETFAMMMIPATICTIFLFMSYSLSKIKKI
jgi:SSS family solute:Na+ symporter